MPWTKLNCTDQEMDINSGRLRFSRYVLFCRVSQRIEDSPLSTALPPDAHPRGYPEWQHVNRFSPGVHHSPHFAFHSGIFQIRSLVDAWEMLRLTPNLRQRTALHVLALWKHEGRDSLASRYITELSNLEGNSRREGYILKLETLEMPKLETNGSVVAQTVFFPSGQPLDRFESNISEGRLIKHGVWEAWYPDGKRELYGHYKNGQLEGRRFQWDREGTLTAIEGFKAGELTEYESTNLTNHPDYSLAQKLNAVTRP